jgi:tetratricopeptide (TPR) repeat protein
MAPNDSWSRRWTIVRGRHLTEEKWRLWWRGELSPWESRLGVRHLLAACPVCSARASATASAAPLPPAIAHTMRTYVGQVAVSRNWQRMVAGIPELSRTQAYEKILALGQWAQLATLSPADRREAIRRDASFQTQGLFERLLEQSRSAHRADRALAIELAELALVVAESIRPAPPRFSPELLADFRASALAHLANAERIAGDVLAAQVSLERAWAALKDGTGDPIEEALLFRHKGNLLLELRQFDQAYLAYQHAVRLYQEVADIHLQGRTLVQQAIAVGYLDPVAGIELSEQALALIDRDEEPRAELCARHTLIWCLNELGRAEEATALLELTRRLYRQFGDTPTVARLHWLEARIARTRGNTAEAERILRHLWNVFEKLEAPIDLTLLTIDLLEVLALQGKRTEAVELCQVFYPILKSFRMHREGLAMWILLEGTLRDKALKENLFQSMAHYYYRSWREPMEQVH